MWSLSSQQAHVARQINRAFSIVAVSVSCIQLLSWCINPLPPAKLFPDYALLRCQLNWPNPELIFWAQMHFRPIIQQDPEHQKRYRLPVFYYMEWAHVMWAVNETKETRTTKKSKSVGWWEIWLICFGPGHIISWDYDCLPFPASQSTWLLVFPTTAMVIFSALDC